MLFKRTFDILFFTMSLDELFFQLNEARIRGDQDTYDLIMDKIDSLPIKIPSMKQHVHLHNTVTIQSQTFQILLKMEKEKLSQVLPQGQAQNPRINS